MNFFNRWRSELAGIAFLLPNIVGFCLFTLIPLIASFILAFTNWNVQLHNMFKEHPLRWVGLDNFRTLLEQPHFWQYFANTVYLMMGIPFSIAGSLAAALLLNNELKPKSRRAFAWLIAGFGLVGSTMVLMVSGFGLSAVWLLLAVMATGILCLGVVGGTVVHRTLFYTPHFTAGVATFILWKKMYNPHTGPINSFLDPVLSTLAWSVNALPDWVGIVAYVCAGFLALFLTLWRCRGIFADLKDGEVGMGTAITSLVILLIPFGFGLIWLREGYLGMLLFTLCLSGMGFLSWRIRGSRAEWRSVPLGHRFGGHLVFSIALMFLSFACSGVALVGFALPEMASDGLHPPNWLIDYHWAKPSLMIMALWAAIGSNNMILYLAGLKNIPSELYEAAHMDGATALQRFWYITWPQLAPFTFFISVMSVIHGLQGGFEMARTMTQGGPAGATTTLSYFIYIEGFETGRLGFASAVAWTLFALVFLITILNVKFGNRYVND